MRRRELKKLSERPGTQEVLRRIFGCAFFIFRVPCCDRMTASLPRMGWCSEDVPDILMFK